MFPNDDICNVDAARQAAQRLFKKYRSSGSNEQPSLGKNEVNNLMKATYEAINMRKNIIYKAYKPDEEDVFSFISVFDSNKDGKIELKDIQELAVKYLCGEEALTELKHKLINKQDKPYQKIKQQEINNQSQRKKESLKIEADKNNLQQKYKQLKIQTHPQPSNLQRVFSPKVSNQSNSTTFYSPKHRIPSKESAASTNLSSESFKIQNQNQRVSPLDDLLKQGKEIFLKYSNHVLGITEANAPKAMAETYELLGTKNFKPTAEDIRIWMKLCDKNKDGVVDWQDFRYFILRTYQRNRTSN